MTDDSQSEPQPKLFPLTSEELLYEAKQVDPFENDVRLLGRWLEIQSRLRTSKVMLTVRAAAVLAAALRDGLRDDYANPSPTPSADAAWLRNAMGAWRERFGGKPPVGQIGKALRPLVAEHGMAAVLAHWAHYLEAADARFASPQRFADTYGAWNQPQSTGEPDDIRPGESVDAYMARLAKGPPGRAR